jgi:uncharacterized phage protein (TIGR02218 family)
MASGAATLCHVWLVTREDGARHGFTDHDRDLESGGVACAAATGWIPGAADASLGLQPGTAALAGALSDDGISGADLERGAWDRARVELRRVDWERPDLFVTLWVGRIARVTRTGERFTAEVEGPAAALDRVAGRTYGRTCDAELGDARCGVDLSGFPGAVCDKRFETCRSVFANTVNFRGFPDIPGEDFLTLTPTEGGRHDGGSRR